MNLETLRQREWTFQSEVMKALTALREIASGEIERGRSRSRYDMEPGKRRMTVVDARKIAETASQRLNTAVVTFQDSAPKPWDWEAYFEPMVVHLEPADLKHDPAENCSSCGYPTRYWMADDHTPLCPDCCAKLNQQRLKAAAQSARKAVDHQTEITLAGSTEHQIGDKVLLPDGSVGKVTGRTEHGFTGTQCYNPGG